MVAAPAEPANVALARAFAALADPTRCAVVELLRERPQRASDLAAALQLAPAGLSRHLRQLERSGLVAAHGVTHDARVRLYRLEPHVFATLSEWAAAMQVQWSEQLQAFKAHAERSASRRR
ncbi:MAG TPA: metalloregulator ArsR/SmtB family transcription factor [Burkholderiaceae bacterium]|nr:metalloregulator ArsR/SmtB family transcription factor [Burkholderiaceae bacterium]